MLTSDQTARSHPALHLGVITAALSKPRPRPRPPAGTRVRRDAALPPRGSSAQPAFETPEAPALLELAAEVVCLFIICLFGSFRESKSGAFPPAPGPALALSQPGFSRRIRSQRSLPK